MSLNERAVLAACDAYHADLPTHDYPSKWAMEQAIDAYLSAIVPDEVAGVWDEIREMDRREAFKAGWWTNASYDQPAAYLEECEEVDFGEYLEKGLDPYVTGLLAAFRDEVDLTPVPDEVAGVVRGLEELAHMFEMGLLLESRAFCQEAASTLTALAARAEKAEREASEFKDKWERAAAAAKRRDDALSALRARLEEAARAIEGLDAGPEFDGVIVEAIEVVRSLKDKDRQNG